MNEDRSSNGSSQRSWFSRLSQILLGEPRDTEDLVEMLRDAQRRDLFDADALDMMEAVLHVSEMQVRDIMIPRAQMVVIDREDKPEDILPVSIESGHSRFPVIGENRDEVVGILHAKDLLRFKCNDDDDFDIKDLMRPAVFVPESKRLNVLLKEFRASRNHIAMVVDEYGGVAGMVTIEDVLEQIVGEITDEHDIEEGTFILKRSETSYMLKALTPVEDFNEYFSADLDDEEFDTIGGYVAREFGHLPEKGETIYMGNMRFTVVRADTRRIHMLELALLESPPEESENLQ